MDISRYLSLKSVTLFYNGGALLEYEGYIPVKDEDTLYLMPVEVDLAEHVFSTLNITDFDGGAVTGIIYQLPEDPIYGCDVKSDEFIRSLLPRLVGKNIGLGLKSGETISGILMGFDEDKSDEDKGIFLNVLSSEKLYRVSIASVEHVTLGRNYALGLRNFAKGELKAYVGWKLDPGAIIKDKHLVSVKHSQPLKEGWRPLYHLYISDDVWVLIVWCEIINSTTREWKEVSITLTTGAPSHASPSQQDGGIVEYRINGPVTIPKLSRILIPVSKLEVKGELQLQTESSGKINVKVNITNESGKVWLPGKITIWKDGRLLGTGEIRFVKNGGTASIEIKT